MAIKDNRTVSEIEWDLSINSEQNEAPQAPSLLRTILQRAGLVYLALFLGLSMLLSFAGIDPLIHNGLLPKFLFVFVGAAVILALGTSEANLLDEQARSWLALGRYLPGSTRSRQNRDRF